MNYYNEIDPKKAAWLRELINRNLISPGVVDERSIVDVRPADLRGFAQCHFFSGIGIWSYALRLAGWPDDRPVWTASCPCQPFSAAGKRKGTADERHLWPVLARLVAECAPVVLIGEQVASKDGLAWFDDVSTDLENQADTIGASDTCAAGYGGPHIRQRLYWVAIASGARLAQRGDGPGPARAQCATAERGGDPGGVADTDGRNTGTERQQCSGEHGFIAADNMAGSVAHRWLEHGDRKRCALGSGGCRERGHADLAGGGRHTDCAGDIDGMGYAKQDRPNGIGRIVEANGEGWLRQLERSGATRGAWAGADWVLTRPQRVGGAPSLRPVEPGSFPLAHGAPARVVRLRGYGDGIVAPQAAAFIEAVMEEMEERSKQCLNK